MTARVHPDGLGLVTDPATLKRRIIERAERLRTAAEIVECPSEHDDETVLEAARFLLGNTLRDAVLIAKARGLYARLTNGGPKG